MAFDALFQYFPKTISEVDFVAGVRKRGPRKRGQIYFHPLATWPPPKQADVRLLGWLSGIRARQEHPAGRWVLGER